MSLWRLKPLRRGQKAESKSSERALIQQLSLIFLNGKFHFIILEEFLVFMQLLEKIKFPHECSNELLNTFGVYLNTSTSFANAPKSREV